MPGRVRIPISAFQRRFTVTALALTLLAVPSFLVADDEPRGFGLSRLFRIGGSRPSAKPAPKPPRQVHDDEDDLDPREITRVPADRSFRTGETVTGDSASTFQPAVTSPGFGESASSRITARPKYVGPVTEADPVLTRVGIARADGGNSFALFLQVYADGTVIDTEGVHRLPLSEIKSILSVIRGHDFSRIRGHCGQPSADFIENVQMVVYDRAMGRLRAHAFSYAGDPNGCDASVAHLHKAVDELIMKMASNRSGESVSVASPVITGGEIRTETASTSTPVVGAETFRTETPGQPIPAQPSVTIVPTQPATTPPTANGGAIVPRLPSAPALSPFSQDSGGTLPELAAPR